MSLSNDEHLWVSWDQYHDAVERLVLLVHRSGWKFDHVLCLARGGLRPGDIFSRVFDVPLSILSTRSYRADSGTVRGELSISDKITSTDGPLSGRVLVVDDLADSGVTLSQVCAQLKTDFREIAEVRTAVIWVKGCSSFMPDYHLHFLVKNPWIHQPFEIYDGITPDGLASKRHEE